MSLTKQLIDSSAHAEELEGGWLSQPDRVVVQVLKSRSTVNGGDLGGYLHLRVYFRVMRVMNI